MTATSIFNPSPAPICEKCDLPLGFVQLDSGKWRPCNPDGSDHWDQCRNVRYAKAKTGECREEVWVENGNEYRKVWWDGGAKPFYVLMSCRRCGQVAGVAGGFIPIKQHLAHAAKHGYTVREVSK